MSTYNLAHLDNDSLLQGFAAHVAQDRRTTAALLAHIAEIDARHLYLRAGFESMRAYCMHELHLSEDAAAKRIFVARVARELPILFPAIAEGRLHLTAVRTLAARLNQANAGELIAAATNKSVPEIETLLAQRFPRAECLRLDDGIAVQVVVPQRPDAIGQVLRPVHSAPSPIEPATPSKAPMEIALRARTKIAILSPERYTLQMTLPGPTHDKLRRAQQLLGHAVPSGDVVQILDRALDALLIQLEKRKFGSTEKPREPRPAASRRCIPAHVRRAVYKRDAGRCTFVGEEGRPCGSTTRLEFDHVVPVARGGKSTVENLRLVCRAHNQYEAERAFGREFIQGARAVHEPRRVSRRSSAGP